MTKNLTVTYRFLLILIMLAGICTFFTAPPNAQAASTVVLNPIQKENLLPGTPSWGIIKVAPQDTSNYTADQSIEGYASTTSVGAGQTIHFAVNTVTATFNADIYRLGWYQGTGARLLQSLQNLPGASHPIPTPNPQTGLIEANWPWTFSITIPRNWVSGMFLVKLTNAHGEQSYIPFVVRSASKSTFIMIHTANTDEAYNPWGGTSLYQDLTGTLPAGRAFKVSFDRPLYSNFGSGYLLAWEYPMIRWFEKNGYDVSYISDVDVQNSSQVLLGHRGILIAGHSEYWSQQMRSRLQTAINAGVNLASFGANGLYWQIRYETSSSNVSNRVITCYRSTALDPLAASKKARNLSQVTVQFRQAPINAPEQTLLGSMFNSYFTEDAKNQGAAWVVSNASSWVFAGTNLHNGSSLPGLVGYEFDSYFPTVAQPATITGADGVAGVEVLASSPVVDVYGQQSIANTTLYTASSGARVFNAGTIQWSWGLDSWTLAAAPPDVANAATQRITANILYNFTAS